MGWPCHPDPFLEVPDLPSRQGLEPPDGNEPIFSDPLL